MQHCVIGLCNITYTIRKPSYIILLGLSWHFFPGIHSHRGRKQLTFGLIISQALNIVK